MKNEPPFNRVIREGLGNDNYAETSRLEPSMGKVKRKALQAIDHQMQSYGCTNVNIIGNPASMSKGQAYAKYL